MDEMQTNNWENQDVRQVANPKTGTYGVNKRTLLLSFLSKYHLLQIPFFALLKAKVLMTISWQLASAAGVILASSPARQFKGNVCTTQTRDNSEQVKRMEDPTIEVLASEGSFTAFQTE